MHSRAFRILLLAVVAVWYAAVLPGHQRGVVQLPGAPSDACCQGSRSDHPGDPAEAPAGSPRTCAVCFYMGALLQAAPPDLGIAPLGLTDRHLDPVPPAPITVPQLPTYLGRAPPLA
jgi:hypothetical protein